jgi:hypothetical protein
MGKAIPTQHPGLRVMSVVSSGTEAKRDADAVALEQDGERYLRLRHLRPSASTATSRPRG